MAVFIKIRQEVIHSCQKLTKFSFTFCLERDIDHITILGISFGCCTFEKKKQHLDRTPNWHFARVIVLDFIRFGWFWWEINIWFSQIQIWIQKWLSFIICTFKKHRLFGGFLYSMNHFTTGSVWILCWMVLKINEEFKTVRLP